MSKIDIEIDHEVRIRLLEEIAKENRTMFNKLDEKIDRNFHWTLGIQIGTLLSMIAMFGGLLLTKFLA